MQNEDESQTDLEIATSCNYMSVDTFKYIAELGHVLQSQCCASDAKLLMFAAAANSEGYRGTLVPIPPPIMGDTVYDIGQLRRLVATWPSCDQILQSINQSTAGYIHLLHWLLITQTNPILRRFKLNRLPGLCKDLKLGRPSSKPKEVLSVIYKDEARLGKSKGYYAYLGCPLPFMYRFLIMGRMDNNWAGPMRLYDQLDPALSQCTVTTLPLPSNCWSHSRFGRAPRCVLICQVLQEQKIMPQSEIIIDDTFNLRARYLLIFTECNKSIDCLESSTSVIIENPVQTRTITSPGFHFRTRFTGNCENCSHRFRGSCGSRWFFRLVGAIFGRVVQVVQRQNTKF
ncbi:hypothetical protein ACLKA6_013064 [Drosophila palustris]